MKKLITLFFLILNITIFSEESEPIIPMLPLLPSMPANPEAEGKPVPLEVKTIVMKMETEIVVPLEIISDVEIQAMVIDDQKVTVPFEIEMNKEPDKKDYYKLNYSETEIDIDIISDVEIQAMVIDDQKVTVPFEIEMNKEPDKKDYYKLNYSETEIDIDDDGKTDTYIYSNEYINSKIEKDNRVEIQGENISKEGYHEKIIYLTIETHD